MEKYVSPEIRTVDINVRNFMDNPQEPPVNPISNVDGEGDGDQLAWLVGQREAGDALDDAPRGDGASVELETDGMGEPVVDFHLGTDALAPAP